MHVSRCVCRADACRARKTLGATAAPCTPANPLRQRHLQKPLLQVAVLWRRRRRPPPETKVPTNASPVPPTPPPPPSREVKPPSQTPTPEPAAPPGRATCRAASYAAASKGAQSRSAAVIGRAEAQQCAVEFHPQCFAGGLDKVEQTTCRSFFEEWHHALELEIRPEVLEFGRGPDGKDDFEAFSRFVKRWVPGFCRICKPQQIQNPNRSKAHCLPSLWQRKPELQPPCPCLRSKRPATCATSAAGAAGAAGANPASCVLGPCAGYARQPNASGS